MKPCVPQKIHLTIFGIAAFIGLNMSAVASSRPSVDPSAPGTIIRAALAFESFTTVAGGVYYMFFPQHYLLRTMGAIPAQVTTTAIQNAQQYGAAITLIGASVGLFAFDTRNAVEFRRPLYVVLLVFEILFIPLLFNQALMEGGMPKKSLLVAAGQLVPFALWRVFALVWRPEWFGGCEGERKVD